MIIRNKLIDVTLLTTLALMSNSLFAQPPKDVNVVNTPNVNIANIPGVNVLNTPIPVTVENAPLSPRTSHLGVPVENFAGILFNDFGGVGTVIAFGPGRAAINGGGSFPVQPGFDWVITDIDYELSAGPEAVCNPADEGKKISLVIGVNGVRNYRLSGKVDDDCDFKGRDYMTAGFVVGAGDELSGAAQCLDCIGAPLAPLQLRGYVVARPVP